MLQELAAEIEKTASAVVRDIHTALPGKIVSFDPEKSVAVVQPKGKYRTEEGAALDYPVIPDVPVLFPYCQASGVGVAFPVKPDDNCLIVVSEIELDEWRTGAESEAPLHFDLTSAIAIPGLMSSGNASVQKAVRENAVVLKAENVEMVVSDGKASVKTGGVEMTVSGDGVSVKGNLKVSGNVIAGNDVWGGRVSLRGHRHSGVHGETSAGH